MNISREQLLRLVPMSDGELARTFRRAQNSEAAAFGNLRRKILQQALHGDLDRARRKKRKCELRLQELFREREALRLTLATEGRMRALRVQR